MTLSDLLFCETAFNPSWRADFLHLLETSAQDGQVTYVVAGDPIVGDVTVAHLLERQQHGQVSVSVSDRALDDETLIDTAASSSPVVFIDALTLVEVDAARPYGGGLLPLQSGQLVIVTHVEDGPMSSAVARVLGRSFKSDTAMRMQPFDGATDVQQVLLADLAQVPMAQPHFLIIPPATGDHFRRTSDDLQRLVARLRGPGGCPWDQAQTNQSLTRNLIEESYELLDAIESDDPDAMQEELGDFILQAYLHCQIAEESEKFNLDDVFDTLISKLVRRHPHVFATATADSPDAVVQNWDEIKREERAGKSENGSPKPLGNVPLSLPALLRAQSVLKRARRTGMGVDAVSAHRNQAVDRAAVDTASGQLLAELLATVERADQAGVDLEETLRDWSRAFEESIASNQRTSANQ